LKVSSERRVAGWRPRMTEYRKSRKCRTGNDNQERGATFPLQTLKDQLKQLITETRA
jgi:hypothetical protein